MKTFSWVAVVKPYKIFFFCFGSLITFASDMKRLIMFVLFMNFLLFGSGKYIHTTINQHTAAHSIDKNHHIKSTSQDHTASIIEDADVDSEEDHSGNDDHKYKITCKKFTSFNNLLKEWYLTFSRQIFFISYNHFEIFGSSCGQSNPIYITQRVLRI